ncbi:serine/threonine protein kinase/Tfp pilus assembly protein PilF [Silvibacterium bohemicum]|uniref:Serine/threonine protein kinase/Tfp pilus assembly protein PilF n=1 Tax=Silvibacterium bohemicum TaxID=1577686 RepID=A0A841JMR3_9BACT|nr:protein kinase [Silvibacterium bohemicum]MBB6142662.1 serine/threonine protein kinase/Tfp pilus assembly protein PilF [Silvibacterium bohemicum]
MSNRRESAEQLFEAALALDAEERTAFLDKISPSDPALRRLVEELLAEDAVAGSFLQHGPLDFMHEASTDTASPGDANRFDDWIGNGARAGRLRTGQILIDRFTIVRFVAKGGMGEVYEVEDSFLCGVHVALKTILPQIAADPGLQQRFTREVLLAREVSHPNLCPIYDIFHCEEPPPGFLFLTMKLLPGKTLAAKLRESTPISTEEGQAILKGIAAGIAAIHAAGIVHRDIKPSNLMLDGAGADIRVWITDFGLARAFEAEPTFPGPAIIAGTPAYIAPEVLMGHPPSQASDLYALGVVLHEIFTGKKPIKATDSTSPVVSPSLSLSGVPASCAQLIRACLDQDPQRRCRAFQETLESLSLKPGRSWTRRKFIGVAAAGACSAAGVAWWKKDSVEDFLHPLPAKRFVALLNWPRTSDNKLAPMLSGALSAIQRELERLEAFDKNLFVISPEDAHQEVPSDAHLREISDPLGANLILAASAVPGVSHLQLILRLLNPYSNKSIRERDVTCAFADITSLSDKAVQAAARLLDVNGYLQGRARIDQGTQSASAYIAFQSAEALMKLPNDSGLDAAIEKYKEAIELDPHYAQPHAELAIAYGRLYGIRRDPGALDLARGNCQVALSLEPHLVDAHLALALVSELTGDERGALSEFGKALALDPSNPKTLVWQAQLYGRLERWTDAEQTFERVLKERPNYWLAYNELGFVLHAQGKFQKAIEYLRDATVAAPGNSLVWSNLGVEYVQTGNFAAAIESLKKSLTVDPMFDEAAQNMSLALRYQGKYKEALPFALKATELNPADDINWLELGECYSALPNSRSQAQSAFLRAAKAAELHLETDKTNGPGWMLLAFYRAKLGCSQEAFVLMQKADSLGANDMDSQLYKARILEILGKRDQALATLASSFRRGASAAQLAPLSDMESLRKDLRYQQMIRAKSTNAEVDRPSGIRDL